MGLESDFGGRFGLNGRTLILLMRRLDLLTGLATSGTWHFHTKLGDVGRL